MNLRSKKYLNYKNLFKFFKIDLKKSTKLIFNS